MHDANYPLQKAYLIALTGITYDSNNVPAYFGELPDNVSFDNYIIFDGITNADASTFNSADTGSLMRVTVHTFSDKYNTGKAANAIANEVFARIYPNSQFNIDLSPDNLQCVSTELVSDLTQDYNQTVRKYLDRIIIFRHRIFHK